MASAINIIDLEDLTRWLPHINEYISQHQQVIPQFMPDWEPVFKKLPCGDYKILGAFDGQELVGYLPYVKYDGPYGSIIHSTPFIVYGGAMAQNAEITKKLLMSLIDYGKNTGCLTVTVCTPPFLEHSCYEIYLDAFQPDYTLENFYQYTILSSHPLKQINSQKRSNLQRKIRTAQNAGVEVSYNITASVWEEWLEIYYQRFNDIGARPYPKEFFQGVFEHLVPKGKVLLASAFREGVLLGGTLILLGKGTADYFAPVYLSKFMDIHPGSLVLNDIFCWLIKHNFKYFNWQSSPGKGGVHAYKTKWGASEGFHHYLTRVVGDINPLLSRPVQEVAEAYKGYFVLPYSAWQK